MGNVRDDEDFRIRYTRSRETQAEALVDELIDIADSSDKENAAAVRNRLETRKWIVGKILSKKYGDKPAETHVITNVINQISVDRQKELQEKRRLALSRSGLVLEEK